MTNPVYFMMANLWLFFYVALIDKFFLNNYIVEGDNIINKIYLLWEVTTGIIILIFMGMCFCNILYINGYRLR